MSLTRQAMEERYIRLLREEVRVRERDEYEDSLYLFLRGGWKYIDSAQWVDGWPIEAVAEHLQAVIDGQIKRLLINIPPRCAKSSMCSVALPAFCWAQSAITPTSGPQVSFLHASYGYNLSERDSEKCRKLMQSRWYRRYWGDRFDITKATAMRVQNSRNGERLITSIGGRATGEGGDCFVAGTLVRTPGGDVPIEKIRVGDKVLSFDHQRVMVVKSRVVAAREKQSDDIYAVCSASGHRFRCTGDHRVFSPGRGYIRVNQMGRGDRILVSRPRKIPVGYDDQPYMRYVRKRGIETSLRGQEGAEPTQPGCLLLETLLLGASRREAQQAVRSVRSADVAPTCALLLGELQGGGEIGEAKGAGLPTVRGHLRHEDSDIRPESVDEVLLAGMRGRGPLGQNERRIQLEFQRQRPLFESIPNDARSGNREGRIPLRSLRRGRDVGASGKTDEVYASCSSFRRKSDEQRTGKPDNLMPAVPRQTSRWDIDTVSSVAAMGNGTQRVYDIQVAGHSNFFADGVLVHNCIIVDDPNAANEVQSEATTEATIEWWDGTMSTRLNDMRTGAMVIIQQRLGEDDLTGHVLSKTAGDWTHLCIPMEFEPERSYHTSIGWIDPRTEPGELMWPERFGPDEVRTLKADLGPFRAAGQLQQRPEPAGGGVIKREWWRLWKEKNFPPFDFILASLDTAYTEKEINDASALTIWGVFSTDAKAVAARIIGPDGRPTYTDRAYDEAAPKVMLMHAWNERLELHELVAKTAKTCRDMQVDKLLIENKAAGISVAQELRRLYASEPWAVQLHDPRSTDKLSRLYSVQHLFSEGMIYAPDKAWAEMVIAQVGSFPKAKHDDLVDTVSQALRHLRDLGLIVRAAERLNEIEAMMVYPGRAPEPLYPA